MNKALAVALIAYEDHPEEDFFTAVTDEVIDGQSRWMTQYSQVWKDKRNNDFWEITWERGSTEYQDDASSLEDSIETARVYPKQITTTVYERTAA